MMSVRVSESQHGSGREHGRYEADDPGEGVGPQPDDSEAPNPTRNDGEAQERPETTHSGAA